MIYLVFIPILLVLSCIFFYILGNDHGKADYLSLLFAGKILENDGKLYSVKVISLQNARTRKTLKGE